MGDWNSELYMKFESERTRAARDLLAQVSDIKPKTVFDLGSGPGNSTQLLVEAFPDAKVVGIDDSPNMLEVARARVSGARFLKEDIERWRPGEPADLIFANATLHFALDHYGLIKRLAGCLAKGGCLAAQMPNNMQEVSHALMRMIAADGPWSDRHQPVGPEPSLGRSTNITGCCGRSARGWTFGRPPISIRSTAWTVSSNGSRGRNCARS